MVLDAERAAGTFVIIMDCHCFVYMDPLETVRFTTRSKTAPGSFSLTVRQIFSHRCETER